MTMTMTMTMTKTCIRLASLALAVSAACSSSSPPADVAPIGTREISESTFLPGVWRDAGYASVCECPRSNDCRCVDDRCTTEAIGQACADIDAYCTYSLNDHTGTYRTLTCEPWHPPQPTWVSLGAENCADQCGAGRGCGCIEFGTACPVPRPANQACPTAGALCYTASTTNVTTYECEVHP